MPLPRFAKLPECKRRSLLSAARKEFAEHGFGEASFNRIIAEAGISKGAMYYYFADKADLYEAVIEDVLQGIEGVVRSMGPLRAESPDDFWAELATRAEKLNATVEMDAELAALGSKLYSSGVGLEYVTSRIGPSIADLIEEGRRRGAVRTDVSAEFLAHATTGLLMGIDRFITFRFDASNVDEETAGHLAQTLPVVSIGLCRALLSPASPTLPALRF